MMLAYAKTAKGVTEIETRADRLGPRLRRLLILIDGKKPLEVLKSLLGIDAIEDLLGQLSSGGYIQPVGDAVPVAGDAASADDPLAALPAERPADALEKARNYMINTLRHFHGQYNKLDLMRAVQASETHTALRGHYADWLRCMGESEQARKRLPELREELFAVL